MYKPKYKATPSFLLGYLEKNLERLENVMKTQSHSKLDKRVTTLELILKLSLQYRVRGTEM